MSQQLIDFVKSLNRNEKRYISLSLKTFSFEDKSNLYISDFNKIEKQISAKSNAKKLTIEGNSTRLYYKLVDILFQFYEMDLPNSDESKVNLNRAKLLTFKGFYKEGIKLLDKIIYHPTKHDYLVKMESLELKLNSAIKFVDIDYLKKQYPEDKLLFSKLHKEYFNLMEFESMEALIKLESTTLHFYGDDHQITQTYKELLKSEDNAFHPLAKIYFNKANAFLALKRGEVESSLSYAKRAVEIFSQFPEIKNKNRIDYLKSIRNLCIVLTHLKKYNEAEQLLTEIGPELSDYKKKSSPEIQTEVFTLLVLLRTSIIIANDSIEENAGKLNYFENEFQLNSEILRDNEKANSHLNFTIMNMHLKNYRQALKHTIMALNVSGKVRKDIYHLSLMNELALHFFLGNTDVLFSKLNAYKRLIVKNDLVFSFEKELPALLATIFNDPQNTSAYKRLFAKINQSLQADNKANYKPFISLFNLRPL